MYDSSAVEIVGGVSVIPSNGTRPHLRAQFRPLGYTSSAASLWIYTSHLNASSATTRAAEAAALRANLDALPAGSHVLTTGDYNIDSSNEQSYVNLMGVGTGSGRMFDPLNRPGTWNNNASFADIHTQSTRVAQVGGGASGGMDDRFDFQLASGAMMDGEGLRAVFRARLKAVLNARDDLPVEHEGRRGQDNARGESRLAHVSERAPSGFADRS